MSLKKEKFKIEDVPEWWDCTWSRLSCGDENCPVCGPAKKAKEKNRLLKRDAYGIEARFEEINRKLNEVFQEMEDLDEIGGADTEDLPDPESFSIYNSVSSWCHDVYSIIDESDALSSSWLYTEDGKDLLWYSNVLVGKTYRQLCNRWKMDKGEGDGEFEYDYYYNQYVLVECLSILVDSLEQLQTMDSSHKEKFKLASIFLYNFTEDIINI